MTYVPVFCEACARGSLARAKYGHEPLACAFCEGQTRPVPGPAYGDEDWLAFAEIDDAVFEAHLDPAGAAALAAELQEGLEQGESFLRMVTHVLQRQPALVAARPALITPPDRGLRMLTTALTARVRSASSA
ncbi:MAG TPA: hypothetical protein VHB79_23840 [Polyangiaceae bacterium]|nr:hypothetical protein [Polyangiaceae bacterium]